MLKALRNTQLAGALCSSGPLVAPLVPQDVCATNRDPVPKRKAILTHVIAWRNLEDPVSIRTHHKEQTV